MKILIATLHFRSLSSSVMERGQSACWIPFPMSFHRPRVDDSKRNRRMGRNTRTSSGGFLLGGKFNPPSLSLRLNVYLLETGVFSRWKCANPLFRGYRETCRCCRFALIIREGEEVGWKACFFPLCRTIEGRNVDRNAGIERTSECCQRMYTQRTIRLGESLGKFQKLRVLGFRSIIRYSGGDLIRFRDHFGRGKWKKLEKSRDRV